MLPGPWAAGAQSPGPWAASWGWCSELDREGLRLGGPDNFPDLSLLSHDGGGSDPGGRELLGWGSARDTDGAENPPGSLHGAPRAVRVPAELGVSVHQRHRAGPVPGPVPLQRAAGRPLRQRAGGVRGGHGAGPARRRALEQPARDPGVRAGVGGPVLPAQLRGGRAFHRGPESSAQGESFPHDIGVWVPLPPSGLLRDGVLPRGDRDQVAEERAGADGRGGVHGAAPERRLDLPDPGDAGDEPPARGRLHLPGGAHQPAGPPQHALGGTV
nr:collagen alpha-4(IV) chain-like isoform X4 [Caretta caretta]